MVADSESLAATSYSVYLAWDTVRYHFHSTTGLQCVHERIAV